jgi:two-component system, NarL family, invasion response regulator UvrY
MTRILIVDDHGVVRRGVREVLLEGFPDAQFGEAASWDEATAALSDHPWDVMLLDINIPGRNGLELLEEVRRRWPRLPVLIVSAFPEEEFAVRSLRLGAAGYLTKSRASDELIAAARKALQGGKYVTATLAEKLAGMLGGEAEAEPHTTLSSRELQVLQLVAVGRTAKEIAAELRLSEKTIATYRSRISEKLGLSTNVEIARYAMQHKLVH